MADKTDDEAESVWAAPFGQAVKEILAEQAYTQKWLAERIGHDPSTVSRFIHGSQVPTLDQVAKTAAALGVTRQSLLARAGFLDGGAASVVELDGLAPAAQRMIRAAVRAAANDEDGDPWAARVAQLKAGFADLVDQLNTTSTPPQPPQTRCDKETPGRVANG